MNVRLHIDRLVIEGIDVPNQNALQAAVEGELGRLIGEEGLGLLTGVALATVRASQITAPANSAPAELGNAIASSVYGAVGGSR